MRGDEVPIRLPIIGGSIPFEDRTIAIVSDTEIDRLRRIEIEAVALVSDLRRLRMSAPPHIETRLELIVERLDAALVRRAVP